jgi:hypothetical protein
MSESRTLHNIASVSFLTCLTFSLLTHGYAECGAPSYSRVDSLKVHVGVVRIVVDRHDFAMDRLTCLSETLQKRHPEWKNVSVLIFTSKSAAKHFVVSVAELTSIDKREQEQLHVIFTVVREKGEQLLKVLPFGMWETSSSELTEIRLPVMGEPHCKLELKGRCLFALAALQYPPEALKDKVSGTITLAGLITRAGEITNIRDVRISSTLDAGQEVLIDAARRNLSSWQLEAREGEDSIEIAFRYEIARSVKRNHIDVEFDLPSQVIIRGNP